MKALLSKLAPVLTSLSRSWLLAMVTLVVTNGWGIGDTVANGAMILDAGYVACAFTLYLYLDPGFKQYGIGKADAPDDDGFAYIEEFAPPGS